MSSPYASAKTLMYLCSSSVVRQTTTNSHGCHFSHIAHCQEQASRAFLLSLQSTATSNRTLGLLGRKLLGTIHASTAISISEEVWLIIITRLLWGVPIGVIRKSNNSLWSWRGFLISLCQAIRGRKMRRI